MLILPAIDLRGGRCVRLKQGDYDRETIFGDDPAAMARRWVSEGAKTIHLVDLDGAKAGHPVNLEAIQNIVRAVDVPCQVGGGLRTEADIANVLALGVARVVLGTRALQDPAWVREMANAHPNRIVLGLDARNGKLATHGWLETSEKTVLDMARDVANWPLHSIVYTDIARDGMLNGPDQNGLAELAAAVPIKIVASGGVTTLDDVRRLMTSRVYGCIIGRALYEGQIDLASVLEITQTSGTTTSGGSNGGK
jgi:phosphoribosylformimino-5-aminoimidazole carboxamide ribotide isomerase